MTRIFIYSSSLRNFLLFSNAPSQSYDYDTSDFLSSLTFSYHVLLFVSNIFNLPASPPSVPVDGVDGDINERLLPIQVSAANIPTAVRLYATYGGD